MYLCAACLQDIAEYADQIYDLFMDRSLPVKASALKARPGCALSVALETTGGSCGTCRSWRSSGRSLGAGRSP